MFYKYLENNTAWVSKAENEVFTIHEVDVIEGSVRVCMDVFGVPPYIYITLDTLVEEFIPKDFLRIENDDIRMSEDGEEVYVDSISNAEDTVLHKPLYKSAFYEESPISDFIKKYPYLISRRSR